MEQIMVNIKDYPAEKIRGNTLKAYGNTSVMERYNQLFFQLLKE